MNDKALIKVYAFKVETKTETGTKTGTGVAEGQKINVVLLEVDPKTGKFRLSRKAAIEKPEGYVERPERPRNDRPRNNGDRPNRGNRNHNRHNNND